jgi:hypothetical protein
VRVDDADLLQSVTRNLATDVIEEAQEEFRFDGDGTGRVSRFQYPRKDEIGKDAGGLQRGRSLAHLTADEHVGAQ